MFYLCSKSVSSTGPKSTGNGVVTAGERLLDLLPLYVLQNFLTALVAIRTRWSISYFRYAAQVSTCSPEFFESSAASTCSTQLNRLMYCKRALMSVVLRDRWSPSILRQYYRPWMLVNSCTEQQIWSGHIQTPTTFRTLHCNQETLELALDSHWKLFITPLHVFF